MSKVPTITEMIDWLKSISDDFIPNNSAKTTSYEDEELEIEEDESVYHNMRKERILEEYDPDSYQALRDDFL